jgi:hypothetical protein
VDTKVQKRHTETFRDYGLVIRPEEMPRRPQQDYHRDSAPLKVHSTPDFIDHRKADTIGTAQNPYHFKHQPDSTSTKTQCRKGLPGDAEVLPEVP